MEMITIARIPRNGPEKREREEEIMARNINKYVMIL